MNTIPGKTGGTGGFEGAPGTTTGAKVATGIPLPTGAGVIPCTGATGVAVSPGGRGIGA